MASELFHYGILRKSGRYPWGSGGDPEQRARGFTMYVEDLKAKGLSDAEIARGFGLNSEGKEHTTTDLRTAKSIAKNEILKADQMTAQRLRDKGMSPSAIGRQMGRNESSVRALLQPAAQEKAQQLHNTANQLRDALKKNQYVDIGLGVPSQMGISAEKLNTAVSVLKEEEGYKVIKIQTDQIAGAGKTTVKVLAPEGTTYRDVVSHPELIGQVQSFTENNGSSYGKIGSPLSISSKRVQVRYGDEGGTDLDGVIQVRRGVDDVSLGGKNYAQVRVAVDGTHYLKGMAVYSDDLPAGVDVRFNTNKSNTGNKLDAMKPMKTVSKDSKEIDPDNPFGSAINRQIGPVDPKTGKVKPTSAMNIVNEQGAWDNWNRNLSSQMLSKQSPALAKQQLDKAYSDKKAEFDEIQSLTNPAVKKKMLDSFADDADSAAVHLKAAALPRQRTQVILPVNSLKEDEVYAPNFRDGEKVVLVRFPHGGTFEIPELTVNNRNAEGKSVVGQAKPGDALDAIGIHSKVAQRLSGADFDGDTVLVIPNSTKAVKTSSPLEGLKNFDPQQYKLPEGQKFKGNKQTEMGKVSNLITDMTIQGAPHTEIAQAVRHSMVVIDAEKHNLDWKQSEIDNGIAALKKKYQGNVVDGKLRTGAATIISRAGSKKEIPDRKLRPYGQGGPIDLKTGEKVYVDTGKTKNKRSVSKDGTVTYTPVPKTVKVKKLELTSDAHSLVSNAQTPMEMIYADHSNRMKALANEARKSYLSVKNVEHNSSATKAYAQQVSTLNAKLNTALKNKPLERQAQLIANATVKMKTQANPNMDADDLKKTKLQALATARARTGASKSQIEITPDEWDAIQAGAITQNKLSQILDNANMDQVKALATPRVNPVMTASKTSSAKAMLANGYTPAQIADQLGVAISTINSALSRED
jgi:DNA-binding CsgD family transcriptional regulator